MTKLTLDEVRDIGTAAIRRVIGDTFTAVEVALDVDSEGRTAYRFTIRLPTGEAWRCASAHQATMNGAIIDALHSHEDERFPFIRILSDGDRTFGRPVAAE